MYLVLVDSSPEEKAQWLAALPKEALVELATPLGNKLRLQQRGIDEQQKQISELQTQVALLVHARQQPEPQVVDEVNLPLTKTPDESYTPLPGKQECYACNVTNSGELVGSEEACPMSDQVTVTTKNEFNPLAASHSICQEKTALH